MPYRNNSGGKHRKQQWWGRLAWHLSMTVTGAMTAIVGALTAAEPAQAAVLANVAGGMGGPLTSYCEACLVSFDDTWSGTDPGGGPYFSASASAVATYGVLRTRASAYASIGGIGGVVGSAQFSDWVQISSVGRDGEVGSFVLPYQFQWWFSDYAPNATAYGDFLIMGGRGSGLVVEMFQNTNGVAYGADSSGDIPFAFSGAGIVSFVFGQPFSLSMSLTTGASSGFSQIAAVDAFHSAYWGGISEVLDSAGDRVAFTLNSESGTDWTLSRVPAVPEPSAYMLLATGLLALAAARRVGTRN